MIPALISFFVCLGVTAFFVFVISNDKNTPPFIYLGIWIVLILSILGVTEQGL